MSDVSQLKDAITEVKYNPAAIQRKMLDSLEASYRGEIDIVDPTNPFVFLLEASAVLSSAAMSEAEALTRKQYASMAQTQDELYLHMSDKDYLNRFATPSRTNFKLLLHKEELRKKAVESGVEGIRKLIIPRHTEFMVADHTFTLQYPIELRVMGHGGFQVVYDVSQPSPLETIQSNLLDWRVVNLQGEDYLLIEIPVLQMLMTSRLGQLNKATSYTETFKYTDQYYYCRVFSSTESGWREIKTTHTDQVFDPFDPTVVLTVDDNILRVTLPHIYNTTELVDQEIRVDIYTTKGELDLILENYTPADFGIRWRDVAKKTLDRFTTPLTNFSSISIFSDSVVVGGRNGVDFMTLRKQVIDNALGDSNIPITNTQMLNRLGTMGYTPILSVDDITNRIYLASRELPDPRRIENLSSAGCYFGSLQGRFTDLVNYQGVIDNGMRITLTPDLIYQEVNGITHPINDEKRKEIENLEGEAFVNYINDARLSFSPFYYVLDANFNRFEARTYHLNQPSVGYRQFLMENDTLGIIISTKNIKVYRESYGYLLRVKVYFGSVANENLTPGDFVAQLAVRPLNENTSVYLEGEFGGMTEDDHRVYDFRLMSDFDITERHGILINNFEVQGVSANLFELDLNSLFTMTYYVNRERIPNNQVVENKIDYVGQTVMGRAGYVAIIQEQFDVKLGEYLEGFWENARSLVSSLEPERHTEDKLATYDQTIYRRDPVTGSIDLSLDDNGDIVFDVLHKKGDTVYDVDGDPVYEYKAGDIVRDSNGDPVIRNRRQVLYETDVFLIDGRFKYATSDEIINYLDNVTKSLSVWLHEDIKGFQEWALEQTEIMLYPRRTMGLTDARVEENEQVAFNLEQSFTVTYYLSRARYNDLFLRETLIDTTSEVLNRHLQQRRVVKNEIISELSRLIDDDVIGLDVRGLGGDANYTAVTIVSDAERCSIKKRLYRTMEGELSIQEDINVIFIRHEDA